MSVRFAGMGGLALAALAACVTSGKPAKPGLVVTASTDSKSKAAEIGTADAAVAGDLVWGFGPQPGAADALNGGAAAAPKAQDPERSRQDPDFGRTEASIRTQFGSSVLIGIDGRVTKQYFLAGDLGPTFLKLIAEIVPNQPLPAAGAPAVPAPNTKVGGVNSLSILGRMLGGREIEVTYLPEFEVLSSAALAEKNAPGQGPTVTGAPLLQDSQNALKVALLLVTAQPSALAAFEGAIDLFYTSIPQIEITVQVIEYSQADALAFGVGPIDATTPTLQNLSSNQLVQSFTGGFPMRQPIVGSNPISDFGLFTLGGIHDSWQLNLALQALEANNLADITSSPKLVVRNGGVAAISTVTQFPFPKSKINQLGTSATDIEFKPIGVKMNIIPVLAGTDSVILQIHADVSAITGFADTDPVVTPITSQRTATTTVYLKNQHSLLIGGLKAVTMFESETKVPLLGDIPVLGFFFRSTSTQRQETSVAFQITPRIVTDRGQPVSRTGR